MTLREEAVVVVLLREMDSVLAAWQPVAPTLVVAVARQAGASTLVAVAVPSFESFGAGSAQVLLGRSALP